MKMNHEARRISILMADDDEDDRFLLREAFEEGRVLNPLYFVEHGAQLLDFLHQREPYTAETAPRPGLILLDLNMPVMSGREALEAIKSCEALRSIPVVVLTTSRAEEDILRSYQCGASSFIAKPVTMPGLVDVVSSLRRYWMDIVEIPDPRGGHIA